MDDKKDAVKEERPEKRSSGSEAILALTACAAGGNLVSNAELSSDCSEYLFDCVDNLKFKCVLILMLSMNVCTINFYY